MEKQHTHPPEHAPTPDPHHSKHPTHGAPRANLQQAILVAVEDLFFVSKISETARKLGAKVRFVKNDKELLEAADEKPSLIIMDLNAAAMKPLPTIVKLKADPQLKKTSVIGYLSHVQGELKQKAHEIGCDMVLARSAFSQNLANLLKRHMTK